ncbi:protein of unknown function (plasmid) [Cupriavidus taiwanensis]|nr:hypothetical protein CBM2597_U30039 [Cupriavidus taiwanensis]SOZ96982.1 hypothetical protein CBM2598_U30041 [Cupriavidus taiwanensis]SPD38033.1 protein of unknown function [Cupriavidus taiwanensis]
MVRRMPISGFFVEICASEKTKSPQPRCCGDLSMLDPGERGTSYGKMDAPLTPPASIRHYQI